MAPELVKNKGLKGKQGKKKWRRNLDDSQLTKFKAEMQFRAVIDALPSQLQIVDSTATLKKPLDPNRFQNRPHPLPKTQYDNSRKPLVTIDGPLNDIWSSSTPVVRRREVAPSRLPLPAIVPALVLPTSGHSYNPAPEHVDQIVKEIIDFETKKEKPPKKTKVIKHELPKKLAKKPKNMVVRRERQQALDRKREKVAFSQVTQVKSIIREIVQEQERVEETIKKRMLKEEEAIGLLKSGKVGHGPKLGKIQYHYRQHLPTEQELGKNISHLGGSELLLKEKYDDVYRRGIFEPKNMQVHRLRKKVHVAELE